MATTTRRDRIFTGFFALLFLITACGLTIAVIISNSSGNDTSTPSAATQLEGAKAQAALAQAKQLSGDSSSTMKLQGTQLKDFTPVKNIGSLQTDDLVKGDGQTVQPGDTVTVEYTGAVAATGTIFQSSLDSGQPATFPLGNVIPGWTQGIPGMKVGGTRRLLIPANLAYGANPPAGSGIPKDADLVFNVTLLGIGG